MQDETAVAILSRVVYDSCNSLYIVRLASCISHLSPFIRSFRRFPIFRAIDTDGFRARLILSNMFPAFV